jgi:hypothetical protein
MNNNLLLSNPWWDYLVSTYTYTIGIVIGLIVTVLKCIAVWHPDEKTNSIVGLLMGWIGGFPGASKWNGQEERRKDIARQEIDVDRREIKIDKQEIKENEQDITNNSY